MGHTATLSKLTREWYLRLKAEGFVDIEDLLEHGAECRYLASSCRTDARSRLATEPLQVAATQAYHGLAGEFLHEHRFASSRDRSVWALHADGQSLRQIARSLGLSLKGAWSIVNRLQSEMRTWRAARTEDVPAPARPVRVDPAQVLSDAEWRAIAALLPPSRTGRRGRPAHAHAHRDVVSALVWLARTGAPWRALPKGFVSWRTCYTRFRAWVRAGVWSKVAAKIAHFRDTLLSRPAQRFGALGA